MMVTADYYKELQAGRSLLNNTILGRHFDTNLLAGWVDPNETWAYASATTITVPSDATTKYSVGDRIQLTQTTVKYFYVVGVAATVLTITGGSDYTLTNAAISANYFSHHASPVGFPAHFAYTVTNITWNGTPPSGTVITTGSFSITNRLCNARVLYTATVAGATNSTLQVDAPVTPTQVGAANKYNTPALAMWSTGVQDVYPDSPANAVVYGTTSPVIYSKVITGAPSVKTAWLNATYPI